MSPTTSRGWRPPGPQIPLTVPERPTPHAGQRRPSHQKRRCARGLLASRCPRRRFAGPGGDQGGGAGHRLGLGPSVPSAQFAVIWSPVALGMSSPTFSGDGPRGRPWGRGRRGTDFSRAGAPQLEDVHLRGAGLRRHGGGGRRWTHLGSGDRGKLHPGLE